MFHFSQGNLPPPRMSGLASVPSPRMSCGVWLSGDPRTRFDPKDHLVALLISALKAIDLFAYFLPCKLLALVPL